MTFLQAQELVGWVKLIAISVSVTSTLFIVIFMIGKNGGGK